MNKTTAPLNRTPVASQPKQAEWLISHLPEAQLLLAELGGHFGVDAIRSLATAVLGAAHNHSCKRVLMDATRATGSFNTVQIYNFPEHALALAPRISLKLAVVFTKPHVDHQFFQNVCLNRFLQVGVFYTRDVALAWVQGSSLKSG